MEPGGRGCFCIWSGGLITWYLQHPTREPLASAVWWKCSVTPPLVLMGSWREPCWWRWCMWHQNRNPAAQANCIAKDVVLLQLPAGESNFQFYPGTHTRIYIYNYTYIYIYKLYIYIFHDIPVAPVALQDTDMATYINYGEGEARAWSWWASANFPIRIEVRNGDIVGI